MGPNRGISFCGSFLWLLSCLSLITFASSPAHGSSLWGAVGNSVEGGGALVGKNYDGQPVHCEFRMVIPREGIPYLGLFPLHTKKGQGPVAGINEKGLAVVSAAPETISDSRMNPSAERITEALLTGYETVDALLSAPLAFKKGFPIFYLIADRHKIALAEIPPQGDALIRTAENGTLFHTNHYIQQKFIDFNKKMRKNSELRLERLAGAFTGLAGPLTMDTFIGISKDRGTGTEDAILRFGGPPGSERTLASWILSLPKAAPPELHVGFFGADETEREYDLRLDRSFWSEAVE
ncbi:MAG TPA: carcinine hydrolase/isopenicillin-N N-acyltransferase family protein [Syntrophorhabdaceae bacterium]